MLFRYCLSEFEIYYYYYYYRLYEGYLQLYTWKNHVSRVYSIAAALYLQFVLHVMLFLLHVMLFVLHVMLFRTLNMFCTFTLALWKFIIIIIIIIIIIDNCAVKSAI
jgi:hypothetical protein